MNDSCLFLKLADTLHDILSHGCVLATRRVVQVQVGGLRDTVKPYNPYDNSGTGWTFEWADAGNFRDAVGNALYTYREFRDSFEALQKRGMEQDLSWDNAAQNYEEVLLAAKYQW